MCRLGGLCGLWLVPGRIVRQFAAQGFQQVWIKHDGSLLPIEASVSKRSSSTVRFAE